MKLNATQEIEVEINTFNFLNKLKDKLSKHDNSSLLEDCGLFYVTYMDETLVNPHVCRKITEDQYRALQAIEILKNHISELKEKGITI